jgi:hypothetical protein
MPDWKRPWTSGPMPVSPRMIATILCGATFATTATAGEVRGFVVSNFYLATSGGSEDCPAGLNADIRSHGRVILRQTAKAGESDEDREKLLDAPERLIDRYTFRGRINGKPVNVYRFPESVPDPQIKIAMGHVGYGFNLDGKESPQDFVDPETGEKGVDDQLYRVFGCFGLTRGTPDDPPALWGASWIRNAGVIPAWLIEITDIDDLQNDDSVGVAIYRARSPITRSANGEPVRDMTYEIDPSPRMQFHARGHIKNGVLTTDTGPSLTLIYDVEIEPEYTFRDPRLRFRLGADGSLNGIVCGYRDWVAIYWGLSIWGPVLEYAQSLDLPGIYYALKHLADAAPDPGSGQNTLISSTFHMEAVPAFVMHSQEMKLASKPQ